MEDINAAPAAPRALDGLRILDLSRILAGPWASQILADLGAEVIKVERPGRGADTRSWGPPDVEDSDGENRGSAYFNSANRGKASVAIDIASPAGQDVMRQLAAKCDVVIENFKKGDLDRYGLDYGRLCEVKPDLIYCSITGFGQTGPYSERAGYDFLLQAMGGLMSITGQPEGQPGAEPMQVGVALTDVLTGLYAVIAILAALRHRDATGEGQSIDLALMDVQVAALANQAMNYLATGRSPSRLGNAHPNIVPYQAFAASDGHLILAIGNDRQFKRFCEVAGRPELAENARFKTNPDRVRNRAELVPILDALIGGRSVRDWVETLSAASVPCGPVNTVEQVFADPQVIARGLRTEPVTSDGARVPGVGSPLALSKTPPSPPRAAPLLGEHTESVLRDVLGLAPDAIADFAKRGAFGADQEKDT